MTEDQLLTAVRRLAAINGLRGYHTHRSDRSDPGFPDLVFIHEPSGRLAFAELKSDKGRLSVDQTAWLDALRRSPSDVGVFLWRPEHLLNGEVHRELRALATGKHEPLPGNAHPPAVTS